MYSRVTLVVPGKQIYMWSIGQYIIQCMTDKILSLVGLFVCGIILIFWILMNEKGIKYRKPLSKMLADNLKIFVSLLVITNLTF